MRFWLLIASVLWIWFMWIFDTNNGMSQGPSVWRFQSCSEGCIYELQTSWVFHLLSQLAPQRYFFPISFNYSETNQEIFSIEKQKNAGPVRVKTKNTRHNGFGFIVLFLKFVVVVWYCQKQTYGLAKMPAYWPTIYTAVHLDMT